MQLFARRSTVEDVMFGDPFVDRGYSRTDAGVRVNHDTALTDDAILAAVTLLAGDIAGLPMRAYLTTEDGLTQALRRQPPWIEAPDPFDLALTDVAHRTQLALSILLAGNAYTLCEPNVLDVQRLTVLDPTRVRVVKPGNERLFEVMGRSSIESPWESRDVLDTLSSAQVLHTPYMLRPGRLEGLSPIDAQAGNLGISIAMRKWVETFFGKGAQVAGIVSLPVGAAPTDVEDVQKRIQSKWSSWRRAGVAGVLGGGATFVKTGLSPQDADLGTLWRRQLEMAARIFGIPPFMIGSQEPAGVAYASSVERAQHYIDHCIARYTRPIEKAYSRLVPGDGRLAVPGSNTEVRFVFDAFLRGDPKARWETYLLQLQSKTTTRGEVRALENRAPLSDYSPEYLAGPDGFLEGPNNNYTAPAAPAPEPATGRSLPEDDELRALTVNVNQPDVADALREMRQSAEESRAFAESMAERARDAERRMAEMFARPPVVNVAPAEVNVVNRMEPVVVPAPVVNVEPAAPTVTVNVPARQTIDIASLPPLKAKVKRDSAGRMTGLEE